MNKPKIAWFSAGITSAVACRLALEKYDNVRIIFIETGSHHPDNERFIRECEEWYGQKIEIIQNKAGYKDHFEVIRHFKFINSPGGARCTLTLKKEVRMRLERGKNYSGQIFGFEFSEKEINRAIRFKGKYPTSLPLFPLIEEKLTKEQCLGIVESAGIRIPKMYELGYPNNNCIGCVKGGKGYWNKIRQDFPEVFAEMAKVERELGRTCLKEQSKKDENGKKITTRIYLDEMGEDEGRMSKIIVPDCGIFCQASYQEIMDKRVAKIIDGDMDICEV